MLRVDAERMRADFDALAAIGATPGGAVDRPSLGDAHLAARRACLVRAAPRGRDPASLPGYLELHIEQGPRLEHAGAQIGVVTGIVGARSFSLLFRGLAGHAGTTPMDARRDAGLAAASFTVAANELVVRDFPGCVATVGDMRF